MAGLEEARAWLAAARSVAALTGAGISAESGVPTYRGAGGLWRNHKAQSLETAEVFARDPRLVWEWYNERRQAMAAAEPNAAHLALAELERRKPGFNLITQNIDGLHDRAGSARILKLHGDIWRLRCTACGAAWADRRVPLPELPPHCACGQIARPGVVWFGESLPEGIMREAGYRAVSAEVFLVIGTSAVVHPAASLAPLAARTGAKVIEINLERTPFSATADCSLQGLAGELLPKLLSA